jgi:hypothetical protein
LLDHQGSLNGPLEGLRNSTKMLLFSLGVLVEHLRADPPLAPRGFHIPRYVDELMPFRFEPRKRPPETSISSLDLI